jgi:hypothetical protein
MNITDFSILYDDTLLKQSSDILNMAAFYCAAQSLQGCQNPLWLRLSPIATSWHFGRSMNPTETKNPCLSCRKETPDFLIPCTIYYRRNTISCVLFKKNINI